MMSPPKEITLIHNVDCQSNNVIYRWKCTKSNCKDHPQNSYVGKTTQYKVSDIEGIVLEHVKNKDPFILKAREQFLIKKFDTFRNGLNKVTCNIC